MTVIGAGAWGSALAAALGAKIISSRAMAQEIEKALEDEYLIFALRAQDTAAWLDANFKDRGQKILLASKGIDAKKLLFLHEIYSKHLDISRICTLTGPSFALEFKNKLPTALVISGKDPELCKYFADIFPSFVKAYTDSDLIGAEICGAYKNIIAIASGICDALKLGNNARASLIARGLVEITRFGKHFGAKEATFIGLSGAGDLFLTASSQLSRNYRTGFFLGQGDDLDTAIKKLNNEVAEGVATSFAITQIASREGLYTPIASQIAAILQGKDIHKSLEELLSR